MKKAPPCGIPATTHYALRPRPEVILLGEVVHANNLFSEEPLVSIILHDKSKIEAFLQQDVYLYIYSLGDLDDFFWPYTIWYAEVEDDQVKAIVLMYTGLSIPNMIALGIDAEPLQRLVQSILHLLPRRFYSHLHPEVEAIIKTQYRLDSRGQLYKMALKDPSRLALADTSNVVRLSRANLPAIQHLYEVAYPDSWFDPRMLETEQIFGVIDGVEVVSIAGIHVYSPAYRVAAPGNITTHPDYRGRGLATAVTARLCQSLLETVDHIGLNVRIDNPSAVAVYKKLGFEPIGTYGEYMIEAR